MRLHRLTVSGFGPFRDEQVVDFDSLTATGLFLLTGDTGAGKSSVLDAVAYALYGRVAGSRASATRVRSDHADPDQPTRVELELTLRGRRMRISRTPEWSRRKLRGSGTTKQPTKVRLERLAGGQWELVSNRADEVGHELGDLVGMNHQQFCQVVLLPQGDFAQFLRADAETRKQLLERLFGTERFSAVEGWLVERRRERGQELTTVNREIEGTIARLAEVTGDLAEPPAPDDPTVSSAWAERQVATVETALEAAEATLAAARAARSAADQWAEGQRDLDGRQHRLRSLRDRASALEASRPTVELARLELSEAQRVAGMVSLLDAVTTATELAADARAAAGGQIAEARLRSAGTVAAERLAELDLLVLSGATVASLEQSERDLRAEITRLEALLVDDQRLVMLGADLARAEDALADVAADLARHQAWLAEVPALSTVLNARRDVLAELVRSAPAQREEHAGLGASIEAAETRERLATELIAVAEQRRAAVDAAQRARQHWQDLRERRLQAMAGELAAGLVDGDRCPVCGATEHPAPAEHAVEAQTEAAREKTALVAVEETELARQVSSAGYDAVAAALQAATEAAGGAEAPAVLTARRDRLAELLSAAARAEIELVDVDRQLAALVAETTERRDALTTLVASRGRAEQVVVGLHDSTSELRQAIDAARGDDPTVAARISRLTAAVDALEVARETASIAIAADADRVTQVRAAERAAADAGFVDLDAASDARRDELAVAALAERVRANDQEAVLVQDGLVASDLADTLLEPVADVLAAEVAVAARADEAEQASARVGQLQASAAAAARLVVQLATQLSARTPLQQAFATVDGLSRLAEGTNTENRLRMRLSYFVLSARLEQVAAAASERLLRMTDGRFSLVHTDDRVAGNQRSGLGLAVCDAWYGTTRDPVTLSGGESFMASLSLALGLADVVVAEAGGAIMDTLFVDEGFGSLDEATLDAVLDVLDGLREGGRAVGLVSHVGELRQRVTTQLTVSRGRSGSTLTLSA